MTIRRKLLFASVLTLLASTWLVVWVVTRQARAGFDRLERERTVSVQRQFQREMQRLADELIRNATAITASDQLLQTAAEWNATPGEVGPYVALASRLASERGLDSLELYADDGTLISSAQRPARVGYREAWLQRWPVEPAAPFLRREDLLTGPALSLTVVRAVAWEPQRLLLVAGRKLDQSFLQSLSLPEGARLLLYRNLEPNLSRGGLLGDVPPDPAGLLDFLDRIRQSRQPMETDLTIAGHTEHLQGRPLFGREQDLQAITVIGSSAAELEALEQTALTTAFVGGGLALLLGLAVSTWTAIHISRPLKQLAAYAGQVAAGEWEAGAPVTGRDEIGHLAGSFRHMTAQLREQQDRLVQAERVAAWRELARRLAHELKNPLFPLQITVENLQRARQQPPAVFDEVFTECTQLLQAELQHLKGIVAQFNDFAKMPTPQRRTVSLNELVRESVPLIEARTQSTSVRLTLDLSGSLPKLQADPQQVHQVIQNLALNALDAMPEGGELTLRTREQDGAVTLEIADTGSGLTPEEQQRLFTPYYTTKHHGTGLGLAIVQSIVSDHGGAISVHSTPGAGTTFRITLPLSAHDGSTATHGTHSSR